MLAGWAIASAAHHHEPEPVYVERVVVVREPPAPVQASPPAPPAVVAPAPPARTFDATEATLSLEQCGVAACRAQGVPRGYVHARVTFGNAGGVTRVAIDAPSGLSPEAVACVGQRIATASVSPFDGDSEPSLGVSWFVP
jgi:hypothetical protein